MFLRQALSCLVLFILVTEYSCGIIPLKVQVLQNPKLFGGDIVGYVLKKPGTDYRNAMPNDLQLWANGVIPFVIDPSLESIRPMIIQAMENYMQHTCVSFKAREDEIDFVNITMLTGCFSNVGRAGGVQVVSLGKGCHYVGTIVHELGHAVGFFHEHQRSDRDAYIVINDQNVEPASEDQFQKMSPDDNRLFVEYDYNSVMHYGASAFSKEPGVKITMKPKKAGAILTEVFDKYGLSESDIVSVNKLYNC